MQGPATVSPLAQNRRPVDERLTDLDRALDAIRRLAGATSAWLFDYRHGSDVIELLAGPAIALSPARQAALCATLDEEISFMLKPPAPRWVANSLSETGEALLVKLVDRSWGATFLILDPKGSSATARVGMKRLAPDLVVLIRYHLHFMLRLSAAEESRDAAREALDHNECGVIALRADHSIVFANAAGTRHLSGEQGLRVRRGALRPVDHGKAIRFEAALDSVIDPAKPATGKLARASVMLLDGTASAEPTIVVIAPAGSGSRDAIRGAAAMIYLLPRTPGAVRGLDTLCQLHGLSRVESRLILHLTEGLTITEAAEKMQIKVDTARTYLKQIFVKTGMRRQTDLVTMMNRYMRAIRGEFDFHAA